MRSARVPTQSGQVGLRPRQEALLLVVSPGLIVLRGEAGAHFAASAGGLLEGGRERATLFTAFAVAGQKEDELLAALEQALAGPDSDIAARRRLGDLEQRILHELRQTPQLPPGRRDHG